MPSPRKLGRHAVIPPAGSVSDTGPALSSVDLGNRPQHVGDKPHRPTVLVTPYDATDRRPAHALGRKLADALAARLIGVGGGCVGGGGVLCVAFAVGIAITGTTTTTTTTSASATDTDTGTATATDTDTDTATATATTTTTTDTATDTATTWSGELDDDGCGCRTDRQGGALSALGLLGLLGIRRRRRA